MEFQMPMNVEEIKKCIPHRYPFLLIDRILEASPGERIVASKNVSFSDPMLQGHFPDYPVVPGVLIVEGIAQAAGVLGYLTLGSLKSCLLTSVSKARFKQQAVPGDTLIYEVTITKQRPPFHWFDAVCKIGDTETANVSLSAHIQ